MIGERGQREGERAGVLAISRDGRDVEYPVEGFDAHQATAGEQEIRQDEGTDGPPKSVLGPAVVCPHRAGPTCGRARAVRLSGYVQEAAQASDTVTPST
ncbi:hypothetical protein GCM10027200_77220 [Lentzea nigeriaca]